MKNCNNCGKCNTTCAIYNLLKKETLSNRNKAFLIKKRKETQNAFIFLLDGSAEAVCPAGIDLDEELIRYRSTLIRAGLEAEENKEMIDNLRRFKTPFGKKKSGPFFS